MQRRLDKGMVNKIAILLLLLTLMVGCSSRKETKEGISLRWSAYGAAGYDEVRMGISKRFEELHPGIKVKYEPVHQEYQPKILSQLASGTAPDVFVVAWNLGTLVSKGTLYDITDWVNEDKDYFQGVSYPQLLEDHTWDGRIYGLPQNITVSVLFYNKDLFDREGLTYPDENWTWQDVLESAKKLTKRNEQGRALQYGVVTPLHYKQLLLYIFQNGGKILNEDRSRCIINSAESREALEFWRNLCIKERVAPTQSDIQNIGGVAGGNLGSADIFFMGRGAMYFEGSYEVSNFKVLKRDRFNWDATLGPISKKGQDRLSLRYYNSLGVWSKSKHPREAYELLKFLTIHETTKAYVELGDSLPLHRQGVDMDLYLQDPLRPPQARKAMLESLGFSKSLYWMMVNPKAKVSYLEQEEILSLYFEKFIIGQLSVEEMLQAIENKLNSLVQ